MRKVKALVMTFLMIAVVFATLAVNAAAENDEYCPECGAEVDYGQPKCLECGNILEWEEELEAIVDIDPDTINLKSNGKWLTAYITLPLGYDIEDIDLTTVALSNGGFEVGGEYGEFHTDCAVVKFDRQEAEEHLYGAGASVIFTVTGTLNSGLIFSGSDLCTILNDDDEEKPKKREKCPKTYKEERRTNDLKWVYVANSGGVDPDYSPYVKIIWKFKQQRKYDVYTWKCSRDKDHPGDCHWHNAQKTGTVWKDTGEEKTVYRIYRSLPGWATQDGIDEMGERIARGLK